MRPARRGDGLRILLVDDDELILESIGIFLEIGLPRASVVKYHTRRRGRPGEDFDWSAYDVLLIDFNLGGDDTALKWLDDYAWLPGFPPTVLLLTGDDPATQGAARERGAGACLNKTRLDPDDLVHEVYQVIDAGRVCEAEPCAETVILAPRVHTATGGRSGAATPPAEDESVRRRATADAEQEHSPRTQRMLLVGDDQRLLDRLERLLQASFHRAEVTQYHTPTRGRPDGAFDWSAFDLLVLDFDLGNGDTGVDWLQAYSRRPDFPRTLLLVDPGDPVVAGTTAPIAPDALLNKTRLDRAALVASVNRLLARGTAASEQPPWHVEPAQSALERGYLDAGSERRRYRFRRLIGRGAMARVYLAERVTDRQTAVVKILDHGVAGDRTKVRRFTQEGELLAGIDSPYVATVFDHGSSEGLDFIAMEFFDRGNLAQRIARGVCPREAVLHLHDIACGLEEVHRKGIVHRDLKPANIMFRSDGSMALADFGIAKATDSDLSLTASGMVLGTPYCMSPEQTEGCDADTRSDLYAAGVLYYEMLTGRPPFDGPTLRALLLAIRSEPVPRLGSSLAPHQPVLDRLLAKDPGDRFQSAGELVDALLSLPDAP
jgi:DNA-binding NarL/FixJ family response regulator